MTSVAIAAVCSQGLVMLALTVLIWRVVSRSMPGDYCAGYVPAYAEEPAVYGYAPQQPYEQPRERLQRPRRPDGPGDLSGA